MASPFRITKSQIALILSLILNILGVTSTIKPLVGAHDECPPTAEPAGPAAE